MYHVANPHQPATPSIFEKKWLTKLSNLESAFARPYNPPLTEPKALANLQILVKKSLAVVRHSHFCELEAQTLGLRLPTLQQLTTATSPGELFNSLCSLLTLRMEVEGWTERWRQLKNGKTLDGRYRWKDFSLSLRRGVNDLLEAVRREEESGDWDVDENAQGVYRVMLLLRREEMAKRRGQTSSLEGASGAQMSEKTDRVVG